MISKVAIFLNRDKTQAEEEGSHEARFLLVRAGHDISEEVAAKYPGALEMASGGTTGKEQAKEGDTKKSPAPANEKVPETRSPKLHRRHTGS